MVGKAEKQSTLPDSPLEAYLNDVSRRFPLQDVPTATTLVHSSYWPAPSTQDCSAVEASLPSVQDGIIFLENELKTIQNFIQLRMSNYTSYRNFQRSRLSPIRKLPNEILGHIFAYLLSGHIEVTCCRRNDIWELTRVCARWRDIIQNTPSFWKDFGIIPWYNVYKAASTSAITERTRTCLRNSRQAHLSITIDFYQDIPSSLVEEIVSHCDRWETLHASVWMFIQALDETQILTMVPTRGLSNLKALTLGSNDPWPFNFDLFRCATALETLCFHDTLPADLRTAFPWNQIKILKLKFCDDIDEDGLKSIMNATPILEELVWDNNDLALEPDSEAIQHPSLRTLTLNGSIYDDAEDDPSYNLPRLCGPHLTDLCIVGLFHELDTLLPAIQSITNLKRFTFRGKIEDLASWDFSELDNIEELVLDTVVHGDLESLLSHMLHLSKMEVQILPSLHKLCVVCESSKNAPWMSTLRDFVRSRSLTANATPLSSVMLKFHDGGASVVGLDELEMLGTELGIKIIIDN